MQQMQLPDDVAVILNDSRCPTPTVESFSENHSQNHDRDGAIGNPEVLQNVPIQEQLPDTDPSVREIFDQVVATTRVYRRVEALDVDCVSVLSSTRSRG